MKLPTTIKKTKTESGEATFFTIAYNGKEMGRIGVYNVFGASGVLGFRLAWHEENKAYDGKDVFFDYTDRDEFGNIITTPTKQEVCRHCEEIHTDGMFHECPDNR